jgi:crossover junction endodeoxyribonuclease RuvC
VKATLALDLGTNTGFAILRADGRIESGTERFNSKSGEGPGGRFLRFRRWLLDVKQANPELARVVYEDVTFIGVPGAAYAVQLYGGFLAIVLMFIEHHQLEGKGFAVGRSRSSSPAAARRRRRT